eukprot:TRINITY_DN7392_c0_g1_i1.p1 TRINITY_DN7392_c0_g1~~TRINITY_DN7392_c0_g1_i1.p1  ORF type:complete len:165 (+),score=39.42 TRINITY_DN7392_c0_g1_i1:39-533(+)
MSEDSSQDESGIKDVAESTTVAPPTKPIEDIQEKQRKRDGKQQKHQDKLAKLSEDMFKNVSEYVQGELLATSQDYKLLEKMNQRTKVKYAGMTHTTVEMTEFMKTMQQKYESFTPHLQQIDEIDQNVAELEKVVMMLDAYTLKLEDKFKQVKAKQKARRIRPGT